MCSTCVSLCPSCTWSIVLVEIKSIKEKIVSLESAGYKLNDGIIYVFLTELLIKFQQYW